MNTRMIIINFLGAMIGIRVYITVLRIPMLVHSEKVVSQYATIGLAYPCELSLHPI